MLLIKTSKTALIYFLLLTFSNVGFAKNCHVTKSNIYASSLVDTTCKQIILPDILGEKGRGLNFACTIKNAKKSYGIDNDSIVIIAM